MLTARYSHRRLHDLAGAVEQLPNFLPGQGDPGQDRQLPEEFADQGNRQFHRSRTARAANRLRRSGFSPEP